jgi:hypothetical protein
MAAYTKYQLGIEKMLEAGNAQTDTWQVILSNTAPNVATDTTAASATELATGGGYTAGGNNAVVTSALSTAGVYKLTLADPAVWTASGGGFTFRYVILYNLTLTQCIGYWDYGSAVVMNGTNADTFLADLDQAAGVFTDS